MDASSIITILSSAYVYTQDKSIVEKDYSDHSINIVSLNMLEKHLQNVEKETYELMIRTYQSLVNFLTQKKTRNINKKWNYGITTRIKYEEYCRSFELQSTCLKAATDLDKNLFVIHLFKKHVDKYCRTSSVETLCQEIFECSEKYFLNEDEYCCRENIKNTFSIAVQLNFPNTGATVEIIGTSKYQLDFIHEDLKLAIIVKDSYGQYVDLNNKYQNLYDAEFLSAYLASIGIENSNLDRFNNGCSFIGLHGVSCYISIGNKDVVSGRDQLILEYLMLDKRVRPLVCAILYFLKCRKSSKFRHLEHFDSSVVTDMVLEFLEKGLQAPLIPNLCNLDIDCKSDDCLYNKTKMNQVQTSYHTCIRIENNMVGKKYSNLEYNGIKPNIWYSDNGDNLATLLKEFFKYYLQKDNFLTFLGPSENYTVSDIQHGHNKNNTRSKAQYSWTEVSAIFTKASESLKAGRSFQYICSE